PPFCVTYLHSFPTRRSSDLFGVTMALYFHGLKNEVDPEFSLGQANEATMSRDMTSFVASPMNSLEFAARVLGGAMARGTNLPLIDRKSTRLNSSHQIISYAV